MKFVKDLPEGDKIPRKSKYSEEAQELRDNSGQWALFDTADESEQGKIKGRSTAINYGSLSDFPRGEFESVVRKENDVYNLYVRHNPRELPNRGRGRPASTEKNTEQQSAPASS